MRLSIAKNAGKPQALFAGAIERDIIARIGMAHDAGGGIVPQDTLNATGGIFSTIDADDHAGMLRKAHADTAAVMQ